MLMGLVIKLLDGGFFQGSVHALDLSVGPGMVDLGQAVLDAICHADAVEDVLEGVAVPLVVAELDAVVGEDRVDRVRYGCDQVAQELSGFHLAGRTVQFGIDELRGAVDSHEQAQLAFFGADLGDVHMKITDRIGLELLLPGGLVAFDLRQAANAVPLQAAMQGRSGQRGDRGLKRIKTVVQRKQRVLAEGNNKSFLFRAKNGGARLAGAHPRILGRLPLPPLRNCLRVDAIPGRQTVQALSSFAVPFD